MFRVQAKIGPYNIYIYIYMTYKLELFLVIQKKKKKIHKYKIIQKLYFLWFTYIGLLVFYTKLTHLTQKFKNLD